MDNFDKIKHYQEMNEEIFNKVNHYGKLIDSLSAFIYQCCEIITPEISSKMNLEQAKDFLQEYLKKIQKDKIYTAKCCMNCGFYVADMLNCGTCEKYSHKIVFCNQTCDLFIEK